MAKNEHDEAASHHENAAKAHRTAADHHDKGNHEEGKKARRHGASALHQGPRFLQERSPEIAAAKVAAHSSPLPRTLRARVNTAARHAFSPSWHLS